MTEADGLLGHTDLGAADPSATPGGLLDVLGVAAVVLNAEGRIALWSPQAEELFGYTAREALGRSAMYLLVEERHRERVKSLFAQVMAGCGAWAGVFPVRHKDGSTRLAEFRNMRLEDEHGRLYALGIASDHATLQRVERDLALSVRLVSQSPMGLAVMDSDLRYVLVNPALERINGLPAKQHLGRHVGEVLSFLDADATKSAMRRVLADGVPRLNQFTTGRTAADPDTEHAWRVSFYRLEDASGQVIGLATSVVDVTEQLQAAAAAVRTRRRLALIADASARIGTSFDLEVTARELADIVVPEFADIVAVDVLDSVLGGTQPYVAGDTASFRALAVKTAYPTSAVRAADPVGELASYDATRLVTQCARSARPVLVSRVEASDFARIARDAHAATLLNEAGLHSYLAVPLIARGEVLGVLDLKRTRNQQPFDHDDQVLAVELAARAAVSIDNARWYQRQRRAVLTLQRHLLPSQPAPRPGLEIAYRYQPAAAADEAGGDWFDVIPLHGEQTALVVGDVMGSGINAAATMGQLRIAARTLAALGLEPDAVLAQLDDIAVGLDSAMATCVFAVYDPHLLRCRMATAGHLPPVLTRPGHMPQLLELPTGAPLGVGGVPFETVEFHLGISDELVLYTDGLVETRDEDIDVRLRALTDLLSNPRRPLEETCDFLLGALRRRDDHDDVALLIARTRHLQSGHKP